MSNIAGKAYAMNVITPIRPSATWLQNFIFMLARAMPETLEKWKQFNLDHQHDDTDWAYTNFTYSGDPEGTSCPVASHMRRADTRDGLTGTSSTLNNRRRILRRGQPHGHTTMDDDGNHGIIFLIMCASLARQFEFVQQQWINYGLDANAGNDTCPIVGNRREGDAKFIVSVEPGGKEAPFIAAGLPQFVETRGGDYFFLPSMTALRMIGMGITDPTWLFGNSRPKFSLKTRLTPPSSAAAINR